MLVNCSGKIERGGGSVVALTCEGARCNLRTKEADRKRLQNLGGKSVPASREPKRLPQNQTRGKMKNEKRRDKCSV